MVKRNVQKIQKQAVNTNFDGTFCINKDSFNIFDLHQNL